MSSGNVAATLELVRRAKNGDDEALNLLSERYQARLRRWAAGRIPARLRGVLGTDDLVQEALIKTFDRIDQLRASGAFHSYLRRAVDNRLRSAIRRRRTVALDHADEVADPGPSPVESLLGRELHERYERLLADLTERERAAVVGRMEWGLSYRELAVDLGFSSPDAVRMAVSRTLVRLSRGLAGGE